ncbi:MAG: hypothetical protein JXN64_07190 [Spirochaetes bacterium]|nr:hypothetical protein [Spirochaetota bacterium]
MEVQLKELIEKIKTEGVAEAEKKADEIINNANTQASQIIEKAKKEASEIISKAKTEQQHFENAGREALKQAGRDLILAIRGKIISIFDSLIKREVTGALAGGLTGELIPAVIREWAGKGKGLDILMSKEDSAKLQQSLLGKLSGELKNGVTIKIHPAIKSGFRISEKDGDSYYDFTDAAIAENLVQYLNPVLADIITKAGSEK